jgi:hypothetical protein
MCSSFGRWQDRYCSGDDHSAKRACWQISVNSRRRNLTEHLLRLVASELWRCPSELGRVMVYNSPETSNVYVILTSPRSMFPRVQLCQGPWPLRNSARIPGAAISWIHKIALGVTKGTLNRRESRTLRRKPDRLLRLCVWQCKWRG